MTESEFRTLDPLADALDEACARWFASPELAALKDALRKAVASLPPTYSVSIDVELRVFDNEREQVLNLLTTGLNTDHGGGAVPDIRGLVGPPVRRRRGDLRGAARPLPPVLGKLGLQARTPELPAVRDSDGE